MNNLFNQSKPAGEDIKVQRKEIADIIKVNLPLMNKNKKMIQEVADAVLFYLLKNKQ